MLGWAASTALLRAPARAAAQPTLKLLADGIYAFTGAEELMEPANQGAICNVGLVVGTESAALIDSGGSYLEGAELLRSIREITNKPLRYLINTHMHPDHIFGNAAFKETGAQIVGHANLPAALEARGAFYLQSFRRQLGDELMRGVEIIPPTVLVADRMELDLGNRKLDLRAWQPAHTDNDLTIMDRKSGILFAGDLVFLGHLPTMDGSILGWMRQLDELAAIPARGVVPGHGPSPSAWPDAIAPERRYFETLATDLRAAIKAGIPLAQAVTNAGQSERTKWKLFDEYNERNATTAYAELEWE
ncbi:MAG: quinoprotein relay system zinc metallohydrolase 2 [Mesorhizobium sp.]